MITFNSCSRTECKMILRFVNKQKRSFLQFRAFIWKWLPPFFLSSIPIDKNCNEKILLIVKTEITTGCWLVNNSMTNETLCTKIWQCELCQWLFKSVCRCSIGSNQRAWTMQNYSSYRAVGVGRGGALLPLSQFWGRSFNPISTSAVGQIMPATLLPSPWIFRPSYGPEFKASLSSALQASKM